MTRDSGCGEKKNHVCFETENHHKRRLSLLCKQKQQFRRRRWWCPPIPGHRSASTHIPRRADSADGKKNDNRRRLRRQRDRDRVEFRCVFFRVRRAEVVELARTVPMTVDRSVGSATAAVGARHLQPVDLTFYRT